MAAVVLAPAAASADAFTFYLDRMIMAGAPNDGDSIENNRENAGRARADGDMEDAFSPLPYNAVCECDGVGIDPTIAMYVPL